MIRMFNVSKRYGQRLWALKDLSFHVEPGETVLIKGFSGSGKTTLLRLIYAAEKPDQGQIVVAGRNVSKLRESSLPHLRQQMGFIFQDLKLMEERTIQENVMVPLNIRGIWGRKARSRVYRVCSQVGISEGLDRRCSELAFGERQLVAVARALVVKPEILLADEPTCHLDTRSTLHVLDLLQQVARTGTTVLVATADFLCTGGFTAQKELELRAGEVVDPKARAKERTALFKSRISALREEEEDEAEEEEEEEEEKAGDEHAA